MTTPKLVIDVNIVLAWMELQSPELYPSADKLFANFKQRKISLYAPDFMLVELANVLKWRYRQDEKNAWRLISIVRESGIRFVQAESEEIEYLNKLMHQWLLTAYDAQYLLVAQILDSKLITTDPQLLKVKKWCIELQDATLRL